MSQLPKTLRIPDVERIKDPETREVIRELLTELESQHRQLYNDLRVTDAVYMRVNGVDWRLTVLGNDLLMQKKISGTWTTKAKATA